MSEPRTRSLDGWRRTQATREAKKASFFKWLAIAVAAGCVLAIAFTWQISWVGAWFLITATGLAQLLRAPNRVFWTRDSSIILMSPFSGDELFAAGFLAHLREARTCLLIVAPTLVFVALRVGGPTWPQTLHGVCLFLWMTLAGNAVAMLAAAAGKSVHWKKQLRQVAGELPINDATWFSLALMAPALVVLISLRLAMQNDVVSLVWIIIFIASAGVMLGLSFSRRNALPSLMRYAASFDRQEFAHVELTQPSGAERWLAKLSERVRGNATLFRKDAAQMRRRHPVVYGGSWFAVPVLWWFAKAGWPNAWVVMVVLSFALLPLCWFLLTRPPVEQTVLLRDVGAASARRSKLVWLLPFLFRFTLGAISFALWL